MDHLSCSQMNLYLQCPPKYKFLYIDGLPKPFKPSGLAFGGSIHAALAWLHKQRMNGNYLRTVSILLTNLPKSTTNQLFLHLTNSVILKRSGRTSGSLKRPSPPIVITTNQNTISSICFPIPAGRACMSAIRKVTPPATLYPDING